MPSWIASRSQWPRKKCTLGTAPFQPRSTNNFKTYSESLDGTKHIFFRDLTSQLEVGRECMSTQLDRGAVLCGPSGAVAFPHQILGI